MARKNCTGIGGQAVLEGVMMRGSSVIATAVRDPDGNIQVESERFTPLAKKSWIYRTPFVRGVASFVGSMVTGTKTLMRASEIYGDLEQEEPSKFEKWLAKTFKMDIMDVVGFVGVALGLVLAVALFSLLPKLIESVLFGGTFFFNQVNFETGLINIHSLSDMGQKALRICVAGVLRLLIFVAYIGLTSLMKDIKRLYRYHGAEHKVISCYEHGLEMTVENAQKMSTVHDRCGTTFMFIVMAFSIICNIIVFSFVPNNVYNQTWARTLIGIACIPFIAGVSYELLKLFAKFDNPFVRACKAPGLLLQKLTTKEPDDSMVEVSLKAFLTVLKMEEDKSIPTTKFVTSVTIEKERKVLEDILGDAKDENIVDLILMHVMGYKTKSELATSKKRILSTQTAIAEAIAKDYKAGKPLQYAMGTACFYGYDFDVDKRVLIPRFDTELLAEQAIKAVKNIGKDATVLDLCTGSGAIGITIAKETSACVTASDISEQALAVAKTNAEKNVAKVDFVQSDLFNDINGQFDVIVSNPPYIPTGDIDTLDRRVRYFEPKLALDGGKDGLDFYRRIAKEYKDHLKPNGTLLLEVGIGEAKAVADLFHGESVDIILDYNNPPIERIIIVKSKNTENI